MDLKKEYEKLKSKYSLPSYEDLDNEFEILYIPLVQEISFPLRLIRRRISDRIVLVCNILSNLLSPNPSSMVSLQESKFFDNKDRDKMMKIFKKLMILERRSLTIDLYPDEKEDAKLVKELYGAWFENKKELKDIMEKLRDGWKKENKQEKDHYFG